MPTTYIHNKNPFSRRVDPLTHHDVFMIREHVDTKVVLEVVRTATVTFVDLVSNVGGSIGLFCGASVLGLLELAQGAARAMLSAGRKRNRLAERDKGVQVAASAW